MTDQTAVLDFENGETEDNDWCTRCERYTEWTGPHGDVCAESCGKVWGHD